MISYFFFQAEDGIRDYKVTGVQTCALPIWAVVAGGARQVRRRASGTGAGDRQAPRRGRRVDGRRHGVRPHEPDPDAGRDGGGVRRQLALSTSSMKLSVLVSTHSAVRASIPIVPMRSVLAVTTRSRVVGTLISRCTAMPRRGS